MSVLIEYDGALYVREARARTAAAVAHETWFDAKTSSESDSANLAKAWAAYVTTGCTYDARVQQALWRFERSLGFKSSSKEKPAQADR